MSTETCNTRCVHSTPLMPYVHIELATLVASASTAQINLTGDSVRTSVFWQQQCSSHFCNWSRSGVRQLSHFGCCSEDCRQQATRPAATTKVKLLPSVRLYEQPNSSSAMQRSAVQCREPRRPQQRSAVRYRNNQIPATAMQCGYLEHGVRYRNNQIPATATVNVLQQVQCSIANNQITAGQYIHLGVPPRAFLSTEVSTDSR